MLTRSTLIRSPQEDPKEGIIVVNYDIDTTIYIFARPEAPLNHQERPEEPSQKFYTNFYYDIWARKGPTHYKTTGHDYPQVCDRGIFIYFEVPDLPGVCNPGCVFTIYCKNDLTTGFDEKQMPYSAYTCSGIAFAADTVSGTSVVSLDMPWMPTGSGTGFWLDTSYLRTDGWLSFGPSTTVVSGQESKKILSIPSSTTVEVDVLTYSYSEGDPVYFYYSDFDADFQIREAQALDTEFMIRGHDELDTFTYVEAFAPLTNAIPAPYSIRNVPYTNIWVRLFSSNRPFNNSTLVFKVNSVDVTSELDITLIPGGMEITYDPAVDFDLNSRVYVDISISCSPSFYTSFDKNTPAGSEYVTVSGGQAAEMQPGAVLRFGPNALSQEETNEVVAVTTVDEIKVNTTTYEFAQGDTIQYIYDDYGLRMEYYFDIVNDYRPPRIINMYPSQDMTNVDIWHWIAFDVVDDGLGVDISTLSFTVNNSIEIPTIYKYSDQYYRVVFQPTVPYYYNAVIECFATVTDLSSEQNRTTATWSFSTTEAELPIIMNADPGSCAYPVHLMDDVYVDLYARGGGVNLHSLVFTIDQKEYSDVHKYPKIYRLS